MFSIIMPVFNKSNYLKKAIDSVVNQTCTDFELILINDGSTDRSLEVLRQLIPLFREKFPDKTILLINKSNEGVSVARNEGVAQSSFPYIAFLDADDWWGPDYLYNMKQLAQKYPEAGLYGSSYYKVKNRKFIRAAIGVHPHFSDGIINYYRVYARSGWMPVWTGAAIVKKHVFDEMKGFQPPLKLGEDFYLWSCIAARYPIAFLNEPLAYYNQDVDVETRAVGNRLYETDEHMLFANYPDEVKNNPDFGFLVEKLALYGLKPYYATSKNSKAVQSILNTIHWAKHPLSYFICYRILSPFMLKLWLSIIHKLYKLKQRLRKLHAF